MESLKCTCVLGQDIPNELETQDEDRQDPLQSDRDFDEEQDIENYLEAAMERADVASIRNTRCKLTSTCT